MKRQRDKGRDIQKQSDRETQRHRDRKTQIKNNKETEAVRQKEDDTADGITQIQSDGRKVRYRKKESYRGIIYNFQHT